MEIRIRNWDGVSNPETLQEEGEMAEPRRTTHDLEVTLKLRVVGRGDPEKIARLVQESLRDGADVEEAFSDEEENGAQGQVTSVELGEFRVIRSSR